MVMENDEVTTSGMLYVRFNYEFGYLSVLFYIMMMSFLNVY